MTVLSSGNITHKEVKEMPLNKNRDSIEILAKILSIANPEARKTQILYRANLSHMLLQKYLGILMENGLMKKEENVFYRTEKGLDFVAKYSELNRMLNSRKETIKMLIRT
jgi:predicted transcriptional regulator